MFNPDIRNIKIVVLSCLLCLSSGGMAADLAGKVVFVRGTPTAVDAANAVRSLTKGSEVYAGDRLISGNGKIQVSMIDGAFISVQPESEFVIETFKYAGQPDGTEDAAFRLVKGGVRAVTGLIGKDNPEAYKVHTSVATIGIRGTGYNTRLCQGDCQQRTDGLYHNTWEGTTYVINNIESRDVPSRNGVFVRDINAPIEVLAQVAGVTAIDTGTEIADAEEEQEKSRIVARGEQRNAQGLPAIVSGTATGSGKVLTGLVGLHVNHDDENTINAVEDGDLDDLTLFFNAAGEPIGALFSEEEDDGRITRGLATIDLDSVLAGDDAAAVTEVRNLLAANDPARIANAQNNLARVEDFHMVESIGWFRWTGGNLLVVSSEGDDDAGLSMVDNQSVHIIAGVESMSAFPTAGSATYNFIGGTRSTTASGATLGNGVTGGNLAVDFATASATLNMTVSHIQDYYVYGMLDMDDGGLSDLYVTASLQSPVPGSTCFPYCQVYVDGGFAGQVSDGVPVYAGFGYAINEADAIIGVAAFKK